MAAPRKRGLRPRRTLPRVDQYTDWLGHANNANIRDCPHCGADNTSWMRDGIHPNPIRYAHMADKWKVAIDRMWGAGCAPEPPAHLER